MTYLGHRFKESLESCMTTRRSLRWREPERSDGLQRSDQNIIQIPNNIKYSHLEGALSEANSANNINYKVKKNHSLEVKLCTKELYIINIPQVITILLLKIKKI